MTTRPAREGRRAAPRPPRYPGEGPAGWALALAGIAGLTLSIGLDPGAAHGATVQDWPPFVLVAGLLLVGMVADDDGLFAAAGDVLGRAGANGAVLFGGAVVVVAAVTAVLNLDTSVAFLTPVLVYAARRAGRDEAAVLYGCLLLSNAASLLLPGSNLTNLIVLGHLHTSGARLLGHLAPAWAVSVAATALVVAWAERASLRRVRGAAATHGDAGEAVPDRGRRPNERRRPVLGTAAVVAVAVLVVAVPDPALAVMAVGVAAVGIRVVTGRLSARPVLRLLGLPVLVGLFGVAVALGTLGRAWSAPAQALSHLDAWATAGVGALASVVVNNLPAASLLAARPPARPLALLVGLDIGPNLFVTGSLAWFLWQRAALGAGARPALGRACRLGAIGAPLAMAAALGALALTGGR